MNVPETDESLTRCRRLRQKTHISDGTINQWLLELAIDQAGIRLLSYALAAGAASRIIRR